MAADFGRDVYDDAKSEGARRVVAQMLGRIRKIASTVYTLLLYQWHPVLKEIERLSNEKRD